MIQNLGIRVLDRGRCVPRWNPKSCLEFPLYPRVPKAWNLKFCCWVIPSSPLTCLLVFNIAHENNPRLALFNLALHEHCMKLTVRYPIGLQLLSIYWFSQNSALDQDFLLHRGGCYKLFLKKFEVKFYRRLRTVGRLLAGRRF